MSPEKRVWWRAFDKVERKIGKPLEDVVASRRYTDMMTRGMKVQRAVGSIPGRLAGGAVEKVLHAVKVPTRGDVRRLHQEIAVLTREVRELKTAQQTDAAAKAPPNAPAKASPNRRASSAKRKEPDDAT
jgi:hypothetical protein